MSSDSPFAKVREFYLARYRPLYDHFVTNGEVPQELHAEVAAAFDHLLRVSPGGEESLPEREVAKVVAHIKRATFDKWNELIPYAEKFSAWAASKKVARAAAKRRRGVVLGVVWNIALAIFSAVADWAMSKFL